MNNKQKKVMAKILFAVETGGQIYGKQRYNDFTEAYTNSEKEHSITIGAGAWYGIEAQELLLMIRSVHEASFKAADYAGIGTDIDSADWSKYQISKDSEKAKCIQRIISSDTGIKCQNLKMEEQIDAYIYMITNNFGEMSAGAMAECINIRHQGGMNAVKRILEKTEKPYTEDSIYAALCTDPADKSNNNQVGDYVTRQEKVYKMIKEHLIPLEEEEEEMVSIILAGHGSGKPSTKGMNSYCQSRQAQNRGLVEVRRFPNLTEKQRKAMHDTYATIIGRNIYSQARRLYCYVKYNGKYYSDCSSSICKTAEQIGVYGFSNLNTAGMHYKMEKVDGVIIKNGIIQNPEILQVGDALMFKGSDPSRPLQIGHTEMVYEIKGKTAVTVPSPSDNTKNEEFVKAGQQHANNFTGAGLQIDGAYGPLSKAAAVMCLQIGLNLDYNTGLEVDGELGSKTMAALKGKTVRLGDEGYLVTALEIMLLLHSYNPNGVESPGIFGSGCASALELFQEDNNLVVDKIAGYNTFITLVG